MIPDDPELRRALDARSGQPSDEYLARLRHGWTNELRTSGASRWLAAVAVVVVTVLTATSVAAVVGYRQAQRGGLASGPRVTSPSPAASPNAQPDVYLSVPSAEVVWALVDHTKLYLSTDLGEHWERRPMPAALGGRPTISFINDQEGWLLAPGSPTTQCGEAEAELLHTIDGGKSWQKLQTAGLGTSQCKEVVYFSPDARHGFVTAWDDNHQPTVYWSVDGGIGWKKAALPDPPDYRSAPGGFNLRVQWIKAVGNTFYLEAYGSQGAGSPYPDIHDRQYIFLSTNGGGTWVWKQKVPSRELAVITESRWLEIDPPAQMSESTNGGQGMQIYDSNLVIDRTAPAGQILFAGPSVGYVSRGGALQRSLDGGAIWTLLGTPWSPSPSPVPTAGFPDCVLPYAVGSGGDHYLGGFIKGTQGQFTPDSQGRVDLSGTLLVTRATPTLKGAGDSSWDGVSYDSAVKRWLPVPTAHVRSDGRAYAYDETFDVNQSGPPTTRIHVVSLDDGKDRVVYSVNQSRVVLGYEPEGIYLMETAYGSDAPQSGLWRLNPVTGAATKLPVGSGYMLVVSRGGLWAEDSAMNASRLYRVNVSTGAIQTWVDTTGWGGLSFYGLDSNGDPLVSVGIGANPASSARPPSGLSTGGLYVFTAPNKATRIGSLPFRGEAVSDSHGTWIATDNGLYLLAPGRQPALVSGVTGGTVAGRCS